MPSANDIAQCRHILRQFRRWYEQRVLGCSLDQWRTVNSVDKLNTWLDASPAHQESELGFFLRFASEAGLDRIGRGHGVFISCGGPDLPCETRISSRCADGRFLPAGVWSQGGITSLDPQRIAEDTCCSYYKADPAVQHPYESRTIPDPDSNDGRRYSWAKAPRYDGRPAETGPLADMLVAEETLFSDWVMQKGVSVLIRELARLARPAIVLPVMEQWLIEMGEGDSAYYQDYAKNVTTQGYGLVAAPRGILGHWVKIRNGKIANYQVITPTAWNGSPMDQNGMRGPWEQAIVGARVQDSSRPVEVEHIVRSFDPCLVCAVHVIRPE